MKNGGSKTKQVDLQSSFRRCETPKHKLQDTTISESSWAIEQTCKEAQKNNLNPDYLNLLRSLEKKTTQKHKGENREDNHIIFLNQNPD